VVQGWSGVVEDAHRSRLVALLQGWEGSTNSRLKVVASGALKALQVTR
jgi:hypothetical protein